MRILYVTTIGGTMPFFTTLIHALIEEGNTVDIAANISESDVPECYRQWGCKVYPLSCVRTPFSKVNLKAVQEIHEIVANGRYDIVHCHTPIAAMCTRLACRPLRKAGVKVFYTAHGFHFFKGAPLKNWLLYYPVEWICARWTDVLITINKEDFERAKKHMHAGRVEYIPGVGVDTKKFSSNLFSREEIAALRAELGLAEEDKMLLSVGELNYNKNHEIVIRALNKVRNPNIHYVIAGEGPLKGDLLDLAGKLDLAGRVHLLGFRKDVIALYHAADLFIHPSLREGLPVALMEAIAAGLPVICSDIRGNTDLTPVAARFAPNDADAVAQKIFEYTETDRTDEVRENQSNLAAFDLGKVIARMDGLYDRGGLAYLYEFYRRRHFRESIGIPDEAVVLTSAGELNQNKNHETVIRALAQLGNQNIYYIIAGEGELHDDLIKLAQSLGIGDRVILLGYYKNVPELYRASDICVFPSIREGLGLAAIEGMACGLPLICADNRGTRSYAEDGINALVCAVKSVDEYARSIQRLADDPWLRKELGRAGMERAAEYDIGRVDQMMREIYSFRD